VSKSCYLSSYSDRALIGMVISRRQWISRLDNWGLRKNLNKQEWLYVAHRVRKRKRTVEAINVFLSGVQLPSKKVRKGLTNCRFDIARRWTIPRCKSRVSFAHILSGHITSFSNTTHQFRGCFVTACHTSSSKRLTRLISFHAPIDYPPSTYVPKHDFC